MSTTTVPGAGNIEAWCDECGSVAYFPRDDGDYLEQNRRAEAAALLHEDTDHAAVWLDADGEPTTTNTGHEAGGCRWLYEQDRKQA